MSGEARRWGSDARAAMLLVHGFNGDPVDMHELEEHAAARGFVTRNLLLPGHGATARHLALVTWDDWTQAIHQAAAALLATGLPLVLVGHSMGAALSLHEAATNPRVTAIAALCPPLRMHWGQVQLVACSRYVLPFVPTLREDIFDRDAHLRYPRRAARWTLLVAAHQLFCSLPHLRAELSGVRCPALIVAARHDHVVPARDGIEAYHRLGSEDKELLVLPRSYHAVTKDVERHQVFERVLRLATRATEQPAHPQQKGA